MKKLILSASSISAFKACPVRFRNAYVYGIRPIEDKESQRIGTNWHAILETVSLVPGDVCPKCDEDYRRHQLENPSCPICEGTNIVPEDIMEAVSRVLNRAYECVEFDDPVAKEVERVTLLHALAGYRWYYGEQTESTITREQYFSLPLLNPQTGHPVPDVFIEGKIDKIIEIANGLAVKEHKSTSKSIDPDSTYWGHLNLDTQTTMYVYAARRLQLIQDAGRPGVHSSTNPPIATVKYDVYHKPQISPKMLTQAESKKFVETGEYMGQKFQVTSDWFPVNESDSGNAKTFPKYILINETNVESEPGKKEGTFAIRETPDMFGARLLKDITERPEFYFRCVELSRTDKELQSFEQELYDICKNMQFMIRSGRYYIDENACEATFRCDYMNECYNHIQVDPDHISDGMKCIFNKERSDDTNQ